MIVPVLIVTEGPPLDALFRHVQGDPDLTVRSGRCRQDPQLHRVQRGPGIPVCDIREEVGSIVLDDRMIAAHALFGILHRAMDQDFDVLRLQRLQFEDPGAGKKSGIHFKIGIEIF